MPCLTTRPTGVAFVFVELVVVAPAAPSSLSVVACNVDEDSDLLFEGHRYRLETGE